MISFSGVWVKVSHVPPTVSAFYRVLFGGMFLLTAAYWKKEITWKGWYRLLLGFLCGIFLSLDLFFWHKSIHYIGPGLATILGNFQVFLLAGLGVLFMGEKVSAKFFFAILTAILGLFLVVGIQWNQLGSQYKTGVYLGLATAVAYTAYLMTLRKLQSGQTETIAFYGMMLVSFATAFFPGDRGSLQRGFIYHPRHPELGGPAVARSDESGNRLDSHIQCPSSYPGLICRVDPPASTQPGICLGRPVISTGDLAGQLDRGHHGYYRHLPGNGQKILRYRKNGPGQKAQGG